MLLICIGILYVHTRAGVTSGPRILKSSHSVIFGIVWIICLKSIIFWISYSMVFLNLANCPKIHTMQGIPVPLEARL